MVDMESENIIMSQNVVVKHENYQEGEDGGGLPEPREPTTCCYCSRSITDEEQRFDCDGCPHFTCLGCRFIDNVQCVLCKPPIQKLLSVMEVETDSVNEIYSMYFKRKRVNKDHIIDVELSTEEGSVQKQMCTICKRVFKKSNARYHFACATGERPHVCIECGQKFVRKSHLESHLNSHYGVRPFKCSEPKCQASFVQKDKLIRHMKSHKKDTKLMCPLCDKLYTSQDILNHHMFKVHSSTKQFRCDQCPRVYKYPSSLRIHRLKHQAKREYLCEVCGKKYDLSAKLKIHKLSHILYHRRPFKCRCGNCGRRFVSRRDRARHELIHSSCHDFECSLCNTTFGRKDNLERHMKNFHQEEPLVLTKNRKLVAKVAPFNSKPEALKKGNMKTSTPAKKDTIKAKTNKVEKQKVIKKDKPKATLKLNGVKGVHSSKCNPTTSANISKENSNKNVIEFALNVTDTSTSKVCDTDLNQKQSVIVSPQQNVSQNRPSVIKSIPHLLPYRILPPDKRFLKLTEELGKRKDNFQTQTALSIKVNNLHTETDTLQNPKNLLPIDNNCEKSSDVTFRVVENPTPPQNTRQRIPKDDALNRCFRIIHHTDAVREEHGNAEDMRAGRTKTLGQDYLGAAMRSFDEKINSFRSRKLQTRSSSSTVLPGYASNKLNQEIRQNSSNMMNSVRPVEVTNDLTNSNVGGPSLSASLSDSVSEINHEDNFTSSYTSMGEATYSSYTPYFDNEYFRDNMNSYDPTVENLLPNDLDIGFQYINEQLGCPETTFSSESRIIRYVSQETRIVRES